MKIAYVTTYDSSDVHAWSGLGNYILRSLQDVGIQTESVGSLRVGRRWTLQSKVKRLYYSKLQSKRYLKGREPGLLKSYAAQVKARIAPLHPDIVFSPSTIPIAYLQTDKPVVFWTDATFAGIMNFYPEFSNLCTESIHNGNKAEQLALSMCRLAVYSSDWAANTAICNYDVDPAKVKVVPFGPNIDCDRDLNDIATIIDKKEFDTCKLLFVGLDWYRKGGDKVLAVAELLNKRGLRTELHIVGCNPPISLPPFVKSHGFISKRTKEGRKHLDQLFADAHFLVLPSLAECCAIVLAEASSFGLPSLATNVGGIPTAIQEGKNGFMFALDASPEKYANCIESLMSSKAAYTKLAFSSFQEYSERLNWHSAGVKLYDLMQEFCA